MTLQALHLPDIESQLFAQESFVEQSSAVVLTSPTIRTINALQSELAERLDESGNWSMALLWMVLAVLLAA